jgi:ORF6N domain.
MTEMSDAISVELVSGKIFMLRGKKVMLDRDLAFLYEVGTKRLNEQVKRNIKRFPEDFMFQLTRLEKIELVAICDRFDTLKHSTVMPYAFTEQGVAMLSSVLSSERAILVNIQIMRAFTQLRRMLMTNQDLRRRIAEIEKKYDHQFKIIFDAIKELITPPEKPRRRIGFHPHED